MALVGAALQELADRLLAARRVALCAHVNPDGDAIGSVLAISNALRKAGIEADPLLADAERPRIFSFLPGFETFAHASEYDEAPDVFLALDTPTVERLGAGADVMARASTTLALDHHDDHAGYADLWACDAEAAAVGERAWELAGLICGCRPDADVAACCYVAVLTDTGAFRFRNVTRRTFEVAAELVACGADPGYIAERIYYSRPAGAVELEGRVASRIRLFDEGRVAVSWASAGEIAELGLGRSDTDGLVSVLRQLDGVQCCAMLRQEGDDVRGSLRAKGDGDVLEAAHELGGGGHRAASGFTVHDATVDEVIPRVSALLSKGMGAQEAGA